MADKWAHRFWRLPLWVQTSSIVATALVAANGLTALFYSVFFADRLLLDLTLTTVIVIMVGSPLSYVFLSQSVKLMRMAEELDRLSKTDDLTELPNRRNFLARAQALIDERGAVESCGALLFIDADHFKALNDTWGHIVGDRVLRRLGGAIRESVRSDDIFGRMGGEEFAILAVGADAKAAETLCERIRQRTDDISDALNLGGTAVTVSVGVAFHCPGASLEALLRDADGMLYEAKLQGRNRAVQSEVGTIAA